MATTIRSLLFIVGSRRPELYESLRRTFRSDDTVQVVLDRRHGERRVSPRAGGRVAAREQRLVERREHLEIEWQLRARGYAVVSIPVGRPATPARTR
jgi:transcription termination factor Rho